MYLNENFLYLSLPLQITLKHLYRRKSEHVHIDLISCFDIFTRAVNFYWHERRFNTIVIYFTQKLTSKVVQIDIVLFTHRESYITTFSNREKALPNGCTKTH